MRRVTNTTVSGTRGNGGVNPRLYATTYYQRNAPISPSYSNTRTRNSINGSNSTTNSLSVTTSHAHDRHTLQTQKPPKKQSSNAFGSTTTPKRTKFGTTNSTTSINSSGSTRKLGLSSNTSATNSSKTITPIQTPKQSPKTPTKAPRKKLSSDQILINCIESCMTHKAHEKIFIQAYSAAQEIKDQTQFQIVLDSMNKIFLERAQTIASKEGMTTLKLLQEFKDYMRDVDKVQTFMQFAFLNNCKDVNPTFANLQNKQTRVRLPSHKFKNLKEKQKNQCHEIGLDIWKTHVFVKLV